MAKPAQYSGTYQASATGYQASYAQPAVQTTIAAQPTTQAKRKLKNMERFKKEKQPHTCIHTYDFVKNSFFWYT